MDVVDYCQNVFLPAMKGYEQQLVHYVIGDVDQEVILPCNNYVEHCLILLPQDKMTSQANDIVEMMWVYKNEYHCTICRRRGLVMVFIRVIPFVQQLDAEGWETLKYGKNYDGYWDGELFVKQVSNIVWRHYPQI